MIVEDQPPVVAMELSGIVLLAGGTDAAALQNSVALARSARDLAESLGVPLLFASSQAVYDLQAGVSDETSTCRPATDYGRTKRMVEMEIEGRATIMRIGNIVGCDSLSRAASKGSVSLDTFPDGSTPRRSYISPIGLRDVILALLDRPDPAPITLNVADPGTLQMSDLLSAAGRDWQAQPAPDAALKIFELDVSRLQEIIPRPNATAERLVAEARAAGWSPA